MSDAADDDPISAAQCRAARGLLAWSGAELAAKAGVASHTVWRFENGGRVTTDTNLALRRALIDAGCEFIFGGVRLL